MVAPPPALPGARPTLPRFCPEGATGVFRTLRHLSGLFLHGRELAQPLEDLDRSSRLRPTRVIRIGVDRTDDAVPIDHEAGRNGKPPGPVTVAPRQVDAEPEIEGLRLFGLARRPRHLRRNDDEAGTGRRTIAGRACCRASSSALQYGHQRPR